jgi:hypothetical protein
VSEKDPGTGSFKCLQPIKRLHHCFAVEDIARQAPFMQRPAEVAGVGRKHGIATGEPDEERLMTRNVSVGKHAHNRTIAENIMFAIDKLESVTNIVIAGIVAVRYGNIRA